MVNIRQISGLRDMISDRRWAASRPAGHAHRNLEQPNPAQLLPPFHMLRAYRHTADSQYGHGWRKLVQRPRCWYFRSSDFDCKKKGGSSQECHAHDGENQYHAVMNNGTCASVHPSSTAVPLLAMDARIQITGKHGKRTVKMSDFYVAPEKSLLNETVLQPDEMITEVFVPQPERGTRSAYRKLGEKESFDWPLADAGMVPSSTRRSKAAVVLGARSTPTPIRSQQAEEALTGATINETTARPARRQARQSPARYPRTATRFSYFKPPIYRTILLAAGQISNPSAAG